MGHGITPWWRRERPGSKWWKRESRADEDLIADLSTGGKEAAWAIDVISFRHARFLYGVAFNVTRDPDRAEDVLHVSLSKIVDASSRFTPGRPVRPWMARIVINTARDQYRQVVRLERHETSMEKLTADGQDLRSFTYDPAMRTSTVEEAVIDGMPSEDLEEFLKGAPIRTRIDYALIKAVADGQLTNAEAAAALGIAPGTWANRQTRARQYADARLDPDGSLRREVRLEAVKDEAEDGSDREQEKS